MEDFYHIFRSVIITKLVIMTHTIILLSFIVILVKHLQLRWNNDIFLSQCFAFFQNLYFGREEDAAQTLKFIFAFSFFFIELYFVCFLFESLNTEVNIQNKNKCFNLIT